MSKKPFENVPPEVFEVWATQDRCKRVRGGVGSAQYNRCMETIKKYPDYFSKEDLAQATGIKKEELVKGVGIVTQIQNGIIVPVEQGPGLDEFKLPEGENNLENLTEFLTDLWFKKIPKDKLPKDVGIVRVYVDDETESYNINGKVITGRSGMRNFLENGFVPIKVFVNGVEGDVQKFIAAFKTNEFPREEN